MKRILAFALVLVLMFGVTIPSAYAADSKSSSQQYTTLKIGSKGQDVVKLQQRLIELKYLSGSADGDYGQNTATAVASFQYSAGLERTGIADRKTQEALFAKDAPVMDPKKAFKPVTGLSAEQQSYTIFQGDSITPKIKVTPSDATDKSLAFKADSKCVSIDKNGKITANSKGKAKITVTAKDGSSRETYFYVYCEPACPVTLTGLGTGVYSGNLLALTFKNECSNTTIKDIYFDVTLKAYNGDTISSGSYHTDDIWLGAGSSYVLKRQLSGVAYASGYIIRITGVKLQDGTEYNIPLLSQQVSSWG